MNTEYRVIRHHGKWATVPTADQPTEVVTVVAEHATKVAAEHHARRSLDVLPHVPVTIQRRTVRVEYGEWEDVT